MRLFYLKIGYLILFILFIISVYTQQPQKIAQINPDCNELIFKTQETKCEITLSKCNNDKSLKFLKCSKNTCLRQLNSQQCHQNMEIKFQLKQKQCYWQCCKSDAFNQQNCQDFNVELKQSKKVQDGFLFLIITICITVLVFFIFFFFYKVIKCKQVLIQQKQPNQCINWTSTKYVDAKCDHCLTYGSIVFTSCNHAYHQQCFFKLNQKDNIINCNKCPQKRPFYLKIICINCRQKYFKTTIKSIDNLKIILQECKINHMNSCQKRDCQAKTDIRLTSSGSD